MRTTTSWLGLLLLVFGIATGSACLAGCGDGTTDASPADGQGPGGDAAADADAALAPGALDLPGSKAGATCPSEQGGTCSKSCSGCPSAKKAEAGDDAVAEAVGGSAGAGSCCDSCAKKPKGECSGTCGGECAGDCACKGKGGAACSSCPKKASGACGGKCPDECKGKDGADKPGCLCARGKAGEPVWCKVCNKGYVDGKPAECPGCVARARKALQEAAKE